MNTETYIPTAADKARILAYFENRMAWVGDTDAEQIRNFASKMNAQPAENAERATWAAQIGRNVGYAAEAVMKAGARLSFFEQMLIDMTAAEPEQVWPGFLAIVKELKERIISDAHNRQYGSPMNMLREEVETWMRVEFVRWAEVFIKAVEDGALDRYNLDGTRKPIAPAPVVASPEPRKSRRAR